MRFTYICNDCHKEYVSEEVLYTCQACEASPLDPHTFRKGNLIVRLDPAYLRSLGNKEDLSYFDFFPYPVPERECFPVGTTPIARPRRLAGKLGLKNVSVKLDSALPSGSFKDRASQLVAAQAIAHGERRIALASTGNAGAAMSCAGAAYDLEIVLFVPRTAPVNKLMQSVLHGATVVPVDGSYDDAFALSIFYTKRFGGINRNTAYNPMTVEGKKSISIELFLQLGRRLPEVIYVPVGDGCIYAGVCKGLLDLRDAGLISSIPKVVCVQSTSSNAISKAWENGRFEDVEATTRADSISVCSPANGRMAVRYIGETDGWATQVTDEEILAAQVELTREAGIFVEPAAACAWAGLRKDAPMLISRFGEDVPVCVLLTGTGFKDMAVFEGRVALPPPIANSVEAVEARFA
jgi:threonine synthase